MSYFSVKNLSAGYNTRSVLQNICFDIEKNCLMGILGANGCGKTTLLKSICGILPHKGTCLLENVPLEGMSSRDISKMCSYIPQRSGISIDISVLDVVLMGFNPSLKILEKPNKSMVQLAREMISEVGLSEKENENYFHLSEGQKQLCILARTLVTDSKLLLLDEPESSLDFSYRYQMLEILRKWITSKNVSAITTLHDPSLALNYCDKLLLLSNGQVLGIIHPQTDSLNQMEALLCNIYGSVNLQRCITKSGRSHLVMLKEDSL